MLSGITFNFAVSAVCAVIALLAFLIVKECTSKKYTKNQHALTLNRIIAVPINAFIVVFLLTTIYRTLLAML